MILRLIFFIYFFFISFALAQSDDIPLSSCFENYIFGSINLDKIVPEKNQYQQEETIKFQGLVENNNDYPIVNGYIFARLINLNSSLNSGKNRETVIDEFFIPDDINILANGAYPLEFSYRLPPQAPKGEYRLLTYFTVAKKFNLSGLSFVDSVPGGVAAFEVINGPFLNYFIDRNSIKINYQEYNFRDYSPVFPVGENIKIEFRVKNIGDAKAQGKISFKLFRWDSLLEENLVKVEENEIEVEAKSFKTVIKEFGRLPANAYLLKISSQLNGQNTIANIRFAVAGQVGRINFIALKKFPLKKNELGEYFTCFHSSASNNIDFIGSVKTQIFNTAGAAISSQKYEGRIYPEVYSYLGSFKTKDEAVKLRVSGSLSDEKDASLDKIDLIYDCKQNSDIINKLEFIKFKNKISVFGLNWCGQKVTPILDSIVIKKKNSNELIFVKNNISSDEVEDIVLQPGEYEGFFQSGQFILTNDFVITQSSESTLNVSKVRDIDRRFILILISLIIAITIALVIFIFQRRNIKFKSSKNAKFFVFIILFSTFYFNSGPVLAINKLECSPPLQGAKIGEQVSLKALGKSGNYKWEAEEGSPSSGTGAEFITSFSSIGEKKVVVRAGASKATCYVNVVEVSYKYSCNANGVCSIDIIQPFKLGQVGVRPINLNFTTTIKDSLNLSQDGKILADGSLISSQKPIMLASAEIYPEQTPRTTEPGGSSGTPGEAGPIGDDEPAGPIGIAEPGGPIGEWNETGGVYDTPPIDFSPSCGLPNYTPTLFASKKERGFILKMGVCAKPGDLKIEGFRCDIKQICYPLTNAVSTTVKVEKTYYLSVKLIAEKGGGKNKGESALNFTTTLIPVKISSLKKIAINQLPVAKISQNKTEKLDGNFALSADSSFDPDKRPKALSYNWSFAAKPSGSQAKIINASSKNAILQSDVQGKYKIKLTVSDGLDQTHNIIELNNVGTITQATQPPATSTTANTSSFSVLCNQEKICKAVLTPNSSTEINFKVINSQLENLFISFYNVPPGITLKSEPAMLNQGQSSGKIIIFSSAGIAQGKYEALVRFKQGLKFVELPLWIEVIKRSFPPLPPTIEILPKF